MRIMKNALVALLALPALALAGAEPGAQPGEVKSFVACPVYRDTNAGRKSGCWLATEAESGVRFDVAHTLNRPYIGRQVLVEGVVSGDKDACGGVVLKPVRVSVLPEACPALMLPPEGYPGRPSVLPAEIVMPLDVPRKLPEPPYARREFHVFFDFGDDFITYQQGDVAVEKTWLYATAARARRVEVIGHADTRGLVASGRTLREERALAGARAEVVLEALRRLGLPAGTAATARAGGEPRPVSSEPGMGNASKRRVTVVVTP